MPRYFLVCINKKLMADKLILPGGLLVPIDETGRFALQYGTIMQVGELGSKEMGVTPFANTNFPEAQVGDTLIFGHWLETDETVRIPVEDDNFIYIAIIDNSHDIKGIQKPDGTIIAHPLQVWCTEIKKAEVTKVDDLPGQWAVNQEGLFVFEGQFEDEKYLRDKIEDNEVHSKYMASVHDESTYNPVIAEKVGDNQKEAGKITNQLNQVLVSELEVFKIHPNTAQLLSNVKEGDSIFSQGYIDARGYPLNYKGQDYILVRPQDIFYARIK